jgi:hypothetical protein
LVVVVAPLLTVVLAPVVVPVPGLVVPVPPLVDVAVVDVVTADAPAAVVAVELPESLQAAKPTATAIANTAEIDRPPLIIGWRILGCRRATRSRDDGPRS